MLPAPSRIADALWDFRGDAARHAIPTIIETVVGFLLAVVLAMTSAVAMDRVPFIRRAVEPILVTSQTIPVVAIAPLFLLWFGFGLLPKILIVMVVTFFPIVVALLDGFGSTSRDASDLLRSYGATDGQAFRQAPLADGAAGVLHRAADRRRVRGDRRRLRGVRRGARGAGDLDAARRRTRSARTSCSRRSS